MTEDNGVKKYDLKLSGHGLNFDREIDERAALTIMNAVLGGAIARQPLASGIGTTSSTASSHPVADSRTSLRGYIDQVGAKILAAKIVAIGAYRRDVEGKEEFTHDDIGGRFKGAGEPAPSNLPRDFQTAVSYGWIAEDHQHPGQYFITKEGDIALANKFEGVRGSSGRKPKRRKKADEKEAPAGADK